MCTIRWAYGCCARYGCKDPSYVSDPLTVIKLSLCRADPVLYHMQYHSSMIKGTCLACWASASSWVGCPT